MTIRDHYPDQPFPPQRQREWVRSVLETLNACRNASAHMRTPDAD